MSAAALAGVGLVGLAGSTSAGAGYTDLYTISGPAEFPMLDIGVSGAIPQSGAQVVTAAAAVSGTVAHALYWNGVGTPIDLHPAGYDSSGAYGASGGKQVGFGVPTGGDFEHALVWNGTNTATDIHPSNFQSTIAFAAGGGQVVGMGTTVASGNFTHAVLWRSNGTAIDLHPPGFENSIGNATDGTQQVGTAFGFVGNTYTRHAMLWNGTATPIDLTPAGYTDSGAVAVSNGRQGGSGLFKDANGATQGHALLWSGTNVPVDLHPAGYDASYVTGMDRDHQVGVATVAGREHAMFWNGTAGSYVDLHLLLPSNFVRSTAYSIIGDTVYGMASERTGQPHVIAWTVPEPATLSLSAVAAVALLRRRDAKKR